MKTPIPANGEAMPKAKPTDEQVADAMREIETPVIELRHMANITCELLLDIFDRPDRHEGDYLIFRFTKEQRDRFLFAICEVSKRADAVKEAYSAALNGEASA